MEVHLPRPFALRLRPPTKSPLWWRFGFCTRFSRTRGSVQTILRPGSGKSSAYRIRIHTSRLHLRVRHFDSAVRAEGEILSVIRGKSSAHRAGWVFSAAVDAGSHIETLLLHLPPTLDSYGRGLLEMPDGGIDALVVPVIPAVRFCPRSTCGFEIIVQRVRINQSNL